MKIALLHTADVHVVTFTDLFADLAADVALTHKVRPDLLSVAQAKGLDAVRADTSEALSQLAQADAVLCTCSTLGPLVEGMGHDHILRIDRPLMEAACQSGPDVMVALCLDSTQAPTLTLLQDCAQRMGRPVAPRVVSCAAAWPRFTSGDHDGFAAAIAASIRISIASGGMPDCVVLAQASMRVALPLLSGLEVPVLASPELAARQTLEVARARRA